MCVREVEREYDYTNLSNTLPSSPPNALVLRVELVADDLTHCFEIGHCHAHLVQLVVLSVDQLLFV